MTFSGINPIGKNLNFSGGIGFPSTFPTTMSATSGTPAGFVDAGSKASFKDVMSNLVQDTNKTLSQPDELMNRALTTGDVDISDVMIANTKADIAVNLVSQVVTKVTQAYDRVQQIQV